MLGTSFKFEHVPSLWQIGSVASSNNLASALKEKENYVDFNSICKCGSTVLSKKKGNVNWKNPIKRYSRESDNFFFLNIVRKILSIVGTDWSALFLLSLICTKTKSKNFFPSSKYSTIITFGLMTSITSFIWHDCWHFEL